jgi:predicted Zn-dependent protease
MRRSVRCRAGCLIALALVGRPAALADDPTLAAAAKESARGDCAAADQTIRPYLQGRGKADADAYRLLADCYARTGRPGQAVTMLREGIAAMPSSAVLQRSLGEALFRQDPKDGEAGDLLRRASQAMPGDPEAGHYYAQWAHVNRQDEICVRKEKAVLRSPGLNDLALLQMYTLLGMCQSRLEAIDEA